MGGHPSLLQLDHVNGICPSPYVHVLYSDVVAGYGKTYVDVSLALA